MNGGTTQSPAGRRAWLRYAGSVVLLAAAVSLIPKKELAAALRQLRWGAPAAALAIFQAIHLLSALKWRLVLNRCGAGIGLRAGVECYYAGLFSNLFLPSLIGGDIVMVAAASGKARRPAGVVMGSVLNRLLDMVALSALLCLAAAWEWWAWSLRNPAPLRAVATVGLGLVFVPAACGALALVQPAWLPAALRRLLSRHQEAFGALRRPSLLALPLAASLGMQLGLAVLTACLGRACGIHLGIATWVLAWSLAKLVALLPITVSGIGARAVALAGLLAPFGAPVARSAALGMAWDAVVISASLAAGAIWKLLSWRSGESVR